METMNKIRDLIISTQAYRNTQINLLGFYNFLG